MSAITSPGIYEMEAAEYHADPCPTPSLSNSIAGVMLRQSPMHARFAHPRLNAARIEQKVTINMDMGTALHALLLGKGNAVVRIEAGDYKKQFAQDARDMARVAGATPLLARDHDAISTCAAAAIEQMRQREDCAGFFAPGRSEVVMAWQEGDVWCRGMVDRMPDDKGAPLFDIKGTKLSASPAQWDRQLVNAYRTQDRFYARGAKALRGVEPAPMRFVVVEMTAPFAISVVTPAPSLQHVAAADVQRAIDIWGQCMRTDTWPGYPHLAHIEAPNWLLREADEQEARDDALEFAQ